MSSDPFKELGRLLSTTEAEMLALQFDAGVPVSIAVREVSLARRPQVKELLLACGLQPSDPNSGRILRAISGAKSELREVTPIWTMPGNEATRGHLTSEFHRIVSGARQSVTAATYNFRDTSQMWTALRDASNQPEVAVTLYVDGKVGEAAAAKAQLPRVAVYRSAALPGGRQVVSHAKFIIIDHELLLITSANFSYSAENLNVEFGVIIRDSALAYSIETTLSDKRGILYELVSAKELTG